MPGRKIPLIKDCYYHVFNRGVNGVPTFTNVWESKHAIDLMYYYQSQNTPYKFSFFSKKSQSDRLEMLKQARSAHNFHVEIIAYCIMPNHFHFLLKQSTDNGIAKFMSNFTNSYTRFFNTRNDRYGPLFQGIFKAVFVETDEQLLHLSRYIHLNPYTSYVVKSFEELVNYQFSSFPDYIAERKFDLINKDMVLSYYKTPDLYKKYVLNQADYQRKLSDIKHLTLD